MVPASEASLVAAYRERCASDFYFFAEHELKIIDKEGKKVAFLLNRPQRRLADLVLADLREGRPVRYMILKARRMGFSTLVEALIFWWGLFHENHRGMVIAHTAASTVQIHGIMRIFYDELTKPLQRPLKSATRRELYFDDGRGGFEIQTAGADIEVGRGFTLHLLHLSEGAFFGSNGKMIRTAVENAVGMRVGTMVFDESTANGAVGNPFFEKWRASVAGKTRYTAFFAGYDELEEYYVAPTEEQQEAWLRFKACRLIGDVNQEYEARNELEMSDEEVQLHEEFKLTFGQLLWRRETLANECQGDADIFRQEYPLTPEEAFLKQERAVFAPAMIAKMEQQAAEPEVGDLLRSDDGEKCEFLPSPQGRFHLYRRLQPSHVYLVSVDASFGSGQDDAVVFVLDRTMGEQVAEWRANDRNVQEQALAAILLAVYFNHAFVNPEMNGPGMAVLFNIQALNYHLLYQRQVYDAFQGKMTERIGFHTTLETKPMGIANLNVALRNGKLRIHSKATLGEFRSYQHVESPSHHRTEARAGCKDDGVMAAMIAWQTHLDLGVVVDMSGKSKPSLDHLPALEKWKVERGLMTFDEAERLMREGFSKPRVDARLGSEA